MRTIDTYNINKTGEITSPDASIQSTLVYALGVAIEIETDVEVKKDLLRVETLLVNCTSGAITEETEI